jgi:hypothetical protein
MNQTFTQVRTVFAVLLAEPECKRQPHNGPTLEIWLGEGGLKAWFCDKMG